MDFEALYQTYFMQVYSYLMTLCRDSAMAEELTQETFFKAMNAKEKSQFQEKSKEVTWLCAIAKNLFTDEMRKRKRLEEMPEEIADDNDFTTDAENQETSFRIHMALHELDEPYKEVFQLRVFGELPFAKIALLFGKTESWARVTYHRAKLKIQERMGEHESKL